MALIRWLDSFEIGIPAIDHEHRELVDLINTCHDQLVTDPRSTDVGDFLGRIFDRITAHFSHEEIEMLRLEFPEYWPHKADHERLLDELRSIMSTWNACSDFDDASLASRLEQWFMIHFRTFDARLHRHVEQRAQHE